MDVSEVRQRFAALIAHPQGVFRLAEGALLIAQEEYPALDIPAYLQRLDAMAAVVSARLGLEIDPQRIVVQLNAYLFDEQGFRGNQEQYYDSRNSFLNEVIERKTGIPITLSVVYIELARLVGLPIVGVGMPGHFLVRYSAQPTVFWIDPYYRGQILTREDCRERLTDMYGPRLLWDDAYLEPVSDHAILQRMLYNLKAIYVQRHDHQRALQIVERLLLLRPDVLTEMRDRGLLHAQLGAVEAALDDLHHYLQLVPDAPDAAVIAQHMATLRRHLSR
ncbi:MAG: tetratricopeptide repeat protein [Candidatus Tectomicrobia bacterium]|uniref:Tetratricopeptide repeat protein n=1 Tax=Tectimicrobiota bacterium TaxID=2528274 RepID=A0A938B1Z3_UNCTE|nr:tetratricopeptide repeat protein [Candidatus Tectomicrobia bacterium]